MAEFDFNGPAEIVQDKYERSIDLANQALSETKSMQDALNASIYTPPTISVRWGTIAAPNLPDLPDLPELPQVGFITPGDMPAALDLASLPDVEVPSFDLQPPAMDFGAAPDLVIGQAPALPQMREVAIPDAPDVSLPDAPEFLSLTTHSFGGVNLHEDWLDRLDDVPELQLLEPAPFEFKRAPGYASELMGNLKAILAARIQGGTGLNPVVEQAIWDRSRDRETQIALAREREVMRGAEALGFPLPSGVLAGQLADARREYHDKLSGLARDIAIKQAELEQSNVKDAITQGLALEGQLMDQALQLDRLSFDAAKTAADHSIAAHNAALERFKALLDGYRTYAMAYETVIKAEMNKVEVYKALLQAEQTKADINQSLVARYKAEIDGRMASVEIYKARVQAAQTLVGLEQTRIQAGGEQIRAFVATINAETSKVELYKARAQAEATKQDAYKSQVQAYGAYTGAQAERARVAIAQTQAKIAAKELEWSGWKAKLSAEVAKMDAAAKQSAILVDGYRVSAHAIEAKAASYMRRWEADIKQYEAGSNISLQTAKVNTDVAIQTNNARLEAAKIGLATASQRVASAWSMVSTSAAISGSVSQSV
ncbi:MULTISPECIES: hypothetical protein [Comamonas]|uniref:hypothetical protein n=1 Tax=Comamonas TaxID=283 RepID=UPI000621A144|nr:MULTISPECIES: hypothetical protein [Comamonas]KKI11824.1 hypothetical protein XA67_22615 [Comamonas thiooxydans]TYK72084.1 hypothetical protein FSY45_22440 [Comamonas sp. Z1]BCX53858.1 hypothetical protein CTYAZ2_34380 [Comamonas testosteroni]